MVSAMPQAASRKKRESDRPDAWVAKTTAATHAGVGWRTLNDWIAGRNIPRAAQPLKFSRLPSGRLRFRRIDIDEFLLQFSGNSKEQKAQVDQMVNKLYSELCG